MSQGRKTDGSLKLHRHKPRKGQSGDRLSFSLHNVESWDIMEVGFRYRYGGYYGKGKIFLQVQIC
nr:MAG TPA: hypothetical protein [Caudoviricetes sp.]